MKLKKKNYELEEMLGQLSPLLKHKDKIGYVAARNTRILRDTLTEYFTFKNELIQKYGEPERDVHGDETSTICINQDSPNFSKFAEEYEKIADIEHEVELMSLTYNDIIGALTGEEILAVDWMLTDKGENQNG